MPTGYTAAIADGITFDKFVLSCARAFGALIMMRDDPADAPIPERFEPSPTYAQWLKDAEARLAELDAMTPAEAERNAAAAFQKATEDNETRAAERQALRVKYEAMLAQVKAWKAPTADHEGLKDFMIKQITESIDWDCRDYSTSPVRLTGSAWIAQELQSAHESIERYRKHVADEIQRTNGRNEWVRALRESLR